MALHINHPEVDRLVTELAARDKKTKTEVVLEALQQRVVVRSEEEIAARIAANREWLEARAAGRPTGAAGRRMTRDEEDEFFGYAPDGTFR